MKLAYDLLFENAWKYIYSTPKAPTYERTMNYLKCITINIFLDDLKGEIKADKEILLTLSAGSNPKKLPKYYIKFVEDGINQPEVRPIWRDTVVQLHQIIPGFIKALFVGGMNKILKGKIYSWREAIGEFESRGKEMEAIHFKGRI